MLTFHRQSYFPLKFRIEGTHGRETTLEIFRCRQNAIIQCGDRYTVAQDVSDRSRWNFVKDGEILAFSTRPTPWYEGVNITAGSTQLQLRARKITAPFSSLELGRIHSPQGFFLDRFTVTHDARLPGLLLIFIVAASHFAPWEDVCGTLGGWILESLFRALPNSNLGNS